MARTAGITQEQVNLVAAELRSQGITPGVRNVREKLGTGSNQTIQAMLQNWQKAQPVPVATADMPPEALPPELVRALQAALASAKAGVAAEYQEAIASAHAQRDRATQDALTQYDEYERQLQLAADLNAENIALHTRCTELQKQVDVLNVRNREREAAEKRAAAAEAKLAMLEALPAKVLELEQAAKATAAAHAEAINKLEAAHNAAIAHQNLMSQREKDAVSAQLLEVKSERDTLRSALAEAQSKAAELGKELGDVRKAAEAQAQALRAEVREAKTCTKVAEEKAAAVTAELSNAQGRISVLQTQADKAEKLQEQLFKLQAMLPPSDGKNPAQKLAKR